MPEALRKVIIVLLAALLGAATAAKEALPEAADPALEARMTRITAELRCLVCQNQTIADSNAGLAVDLRRETREMLRQGKSDAEIIAYMTARYGDFVLYRPPVKPTTWLLWFGPFVLLAGGGVVWWFISRRRKRREDEGDLTPSGADAPGAGLAKARALLDSPLE